MKQYKKDKREAFPGNGKLKPTDQKQNELQQRIRDLEEEKS